MQTSKHIESWPTEGLDSVKFCPVCRSNERELLYSCLTDRVFFCAPGRWSLFKCRDCKSGYLDPRPNIHTIGRAYSKYFTHSFKKATEFKNLSFTKKLKRILTNGYRNFRFGSKEKPSCLIGILLTILMPRRRFNFEVESRSLPKLKKDFRLLDIGCGNGDFLDFAQKIGWIAVGLDFDPKAVEAARSRGLDVRLGGVEILNPKVEQFDGITLSHVIEHVHDPSSLLSACHNLLKPGGWVWLETPNLDSIGHSEYGENWRGLEPPRHLVLFNQTSLKLLLTKVGFSKIKNLPSPPVYKFMFLSSEAISRAEPYFHQDSNMVSKALKIRIKNAERRAKKDGELGEFITFKAWKI